MQTIESQRVIGRFFEAINALIESKVIRGKQTFTNRYGINRRNFGTLEKDLSRDIFQTSWLTYLVDDYDISPRWLLTGVGEMYEKRVKKH